MKYRKLKLMANFEDVGAVPLHIESGKILTGNISKYTSVYLIICRIRVCIYSDLE